MMTPYGNRGLAGFFMQGGPQGRPMGMPQTPFHQAGPGPANQPMAPGMGGLADFMQHGMPPQMPGQMPQPMPGNLGPGSFGTGMSQPMPRGPTNMGPGSMPYRPMPRMGLK